MTRPIHGRNGRFRIGATTAAVSYPFKKCTFRYKVEATDTTNSESTIADTAADSGTATFSEFVAGVTEGSFSISGDIKVGAPILAAMKPGNIIANVAVQLSREATPDTIKFGFTGSATVAEAGLFVEEVEIGDEVRGMVSYSLQCKTSGPFLLPW